MWLLVIFCFSWLASEVTFFLSLLGEQQQRDLNEFVVEIKIEQVEREIIKKIIIVDIPFPALKDSLCVE